MPPRSRQRAHCDIIDFNIDFELVSSFSISILGIVAFIVGLALLSFIRAVRAELENLRHEIIELRKGKP